jgi:DNA (cytosine-5)-methyltransferase 1
MHLFAGIGGGLLADLILGHRPVVAVEWDKYACSVLRERAADGWFPDLSVWEGDVRLFDPSEYIGQVDCIHAGFPCQDISLAGKQAGVSEGTRSGLYREVLRIAGVVRPKQLFLENVSAILSNGLGTVLGDLASLGYDCRWLCIRASDVGAPHHRDRWFCLANAKPDADSTIKNPQGITQRVESENGAKRLAGLPVGAGFDSEVLAYPYSCGRVRWGFEKARQQTGRKVNRHDAESGNVADTNKQRRKKFDATKITENSGRHGWCVVEGWSSSWWKVEPQLGRVADGIPNRVDRIGGPGNAVVPQIPEIIGRAIMSVQQATP